jgi:hypothetical protein
MSTTDQGYLDGNAAAGALGEIFTVELTAANGQCEGCGRTGVLAETRAWTDAPGLVLRCVGCDGVLLRLVTGGGRTWLDLRGLRYLEFTTPDR